MSRSVGSADSVSIPHNTSTTETEDRQNKQSEQKDATTSAATTTLDHVGKEGNACESKPPA